MAKLKLLSADMAAVYGLPPWDSDTEAILKTYAARGWKGADIMRHIDKAVESGAYAKEETKQVYPTRSEKVVKAGDAGENK